MHVRSDFRRAFWVSFRPSGWMLVGAVFLGACIDSVGSGQVAADGTIVTDIVIPAVDFSGSEAEPAADLVFGDKDAFGTPETAADEVSETFEDVPTDSADEVSRVDGITVDVAIVDADGTSDAGGDIPTDVVGPDVMDEADGVADVWDVADVEATLDVFPSEDGMITDVVQMDDGGIVADVPDTATPVDVVASADVPPVPCTKETTGCFAPIAYGPAAHITMLQVGKFGYVGESLDLDPENGPQDCAPTDYCEQGIDNALSSLGELSNGPLQDLFSDGDIILLVEAPDGVSLDNSFPLTGYVGKKAPNQPNCDIQSEVCEYIVTLESFGCMCEPVIHFADAWWDKSGWLTTGEGTFSLAYPIAPGVVIQVTLYRARLVAHATISNQVMVLQDGVVAGALKPEQLSAAVEAWPSDNLGGFSKTLILALLNGLLTDVDTDGDSQDDAVSIGFKFQSVGAKLIVP